MKKKFKPKHPIFSFEYPETSETKTGSNIDNKSTITITTYNIYSFRKQDIFQKVETEIT